MFAVKFDKGKLFCYERHEIGAMQYTSHENISVVPSVLRQTLTHHLGFIYEEAVLAARCGFWRQIR